MAVASPFYVPYDKITPLANARGERFICLWQAFPWLKSLYTKYGASPPCLSGVALIEGRGLSWAFCLGSCV